MIISGETLRFSDMVMDSVISGDFSTKLDNVAYSTNPREVIKIKHMLDYHYRKEVKEKQQEELDMLYGKFHKPKSKGVVFDEYN